MTNSLYITYLWLPSPKPRRYPGFFLEIQTRQWLPKPEAKSRSTDDSRGRFAAAVNGTDLELSSASSQAEWKKKQWQQTNCHCYYYHSCMLLYKSWYGESRGIIHFFWNPSFTCSIIRKYCKTVRMIMISDNNRNDHHHHHHLYPEHHLFIIIVVIIIIIIIIIIITFIPSIIFSSSS